MLWSCLIVVVGVLALYGGAEMLVRGSSRLALSLGIPGLIVGVVIVGMGTSMPELVSSLMALRLGDSGDIAIGNVLGSNIANIALVLGIAALLEPIPLPKGVRVREVVWALVAIATLTATMAYGHFTRPIGVILLLVLASYIRHQYVVARRHREQLVDKIPHPHGVWGWLKEASGDLVLIAAGLVLLILGGRWLVSGSITLAEAFGISERVIGLTIVAVGTSSPELATAVVAGLKGSHDLSLGNILGSNIFNTFAILGLCAIALPFTFSPELFWYDLPVMAILYLGLAALLRHRHQIGRVIGGCLVGGYVVYVAWLVAG